MSTYCFPAETKNTNSRQQRETEQIRHRIHAYLLSVDLQLLPSNEENRQLINEIVNRIVDNCTGDTLAQRYRLAFRRAAEIAADMVTTRALAVIPREDHSVMIPAQPVRAAAPLRWNWWLAGFVQSSTPEHTIDVVSP